MDQLSMTNAEFHRDFELLLIKGEMSLLKGDLISGLDLFDSAIKKEPNNPMIFYRQGLSLFEYGSEEGKEKALLLASKKFKQALVLDPRFYDAWQAWGNVLYLLGTRYKEHHYFLEAKEKYQKALELTDSMSSDSLATLYWDYALVWTRIAEHSGEALDFQLTLDAFQKASSFQDPLPSEFWNDFGHACLELASRINDVRLYVKAINCFKYSLSNALSACDGWIALAKALQMLYSHTHDEDHFSQANECFTTAAQLRPYDASLWLNWASFLCESGRRNQDTKRLRSCIEKCHRAYASDPFEPLTTAIWAEALALIGELSDRLDLIYEAQNKIAEAVDAAEDSPEVWYSFGMCLNSFAAYFNDFDFYYQAIEKFQQGLSIDRTSHKNWHAIAKAYTIIGLIEADAETLEKSLRFYGKAIDLKASSFYIFDYAVALSKLGEMTHQKKWVEDAMMQFERALGIQKNAIYLHPDWLFHYACTLDMLGDYYEEEFCYAKAIEIFSHVLMIDPDFPFVHHRLALAYSHLGELMSEVDSFYRAIHHFRLAIKHEEENDQVILDLGITLINLAQHTRETAEADQLYREAEHKITQSAKLGNLQAFYHLGCLYSLLGQFEKSMRFIEKAQQFDALPPLEELLQDDWLESLRATSDFREFLSHLEKKA